MIKYTVLTYIINNYEIVHEIEEKDPEAEYVLVTDAKNLTSKTWNVVYDTDLEGLSLFDKCYQIRFNWYKYCNTDICLRVDGSMTVKRSLRPLIDIFNEGGYDICLMPHPERYYFKDEYDVWVKNRHYPQQQADKCMRIMKEKGYDFSYKGMFQFGFCIQRNNEVNRELNRRSLELLHEMGLGGVIERLDQIPFSFLVNTEFRDMKILPVSEQLLHSIYIQHHHHGNSFLFLNKNYDIDKPDMKYMFNKPTQCLYMDIPLDIKEFHKREKELHNYINLLQNKYWTNEYYKKRYKKYKYMSIYLGVFAIALMAVILVLEL